MYPLKTTNHSVGLYLLSLCSVICSSEQPLHAVGEAIVEVLQHRSVSAAHNLLTRNHSIG